MFLKPKGYTCVIKLISFKWALQSIIHTAKSSEYFLACLWTWCLLASVQIHGLDGNKGPRNNLQETILLLNLRKFTYIDVSCSLIFSLSARKWSWWVFHFLIQAKSKWQWSVWKASNDSPSSYYKECITHIISIFENI